MASEDVIELGSSDDEAEPAPKKKKMMPNVMLHIPTKLHGITITPAKTKLSSTNKGPIRSQVVIHNKTNLKSNPIMIKPNLVIGKIKPNSGTIKELNNKTVVKDSTKNFALPNCQGLINPLNIVKNLNKTEVVIKKIPSNKNAIRPIKIHALNNLPPGIIVKPVLQSAVSTEVTRKPVPNAGTSGTYKKQRLVGLRKKPPKEMLTVEIDDEDVTESTSSPQWYLRPEHTGDKEKVNKNKEADVTIESLEPSMEQKNNKEPENTKFVEITIEDSPIKPVLSKPTNIGKELTITIEDSPVKPVPKSTKDVLSDSETNEIVRNSCPQSKKKLGYPKESEDHHVVEIEIDLKDDSVKKSETETINKLDSPNQKTNICSEMSPKEKLEVEVVTDSKKEAADKVTQAKEKDFADDEFHHVYQKFINMCFQLENTDDMKKIVEKKIKSYYRQCSKDYVESEEFIDMVSSKIDSMKAAPEKMYLYIKDVVDELNLQRKMLNSVIANKVEVEKAPTEKYEGYDSKKRKQIRKLEKTIKKLHRAIQKLEEQEVDFDDEEDSVYMLTERYKDRMVRVHAKFCQLTKTKMPSEPRVHIEARAGRPQGPAKKLEKWINRKVPIGTPLPFPDFHDVLRCVQDANQEEKLGWKDFDIMEEARDLFTRCGKKLQRRRQENEWRIAASRISTETDPAENSLELKRKLDENKTQAAKKEAELLNKYVDRQNLLKLEAEEIGDKEANESPVESEEEGEITEDDNPLQDKQKRKQRLKRLLKEKSKKDEDKENNAIKIPEDSKNKKETIIEGSKVSEQEQAGVELIEDKTSNVEKQIESSESTETKITEDKIMEVDDVEDQNINTDSDSKKVESDIDELHLLQKLHSENEANSSLESSDSDTPIAISDTLESDSDVDNGAKSFDIISIENSSYSESESTVDGFSKNNDSNSINKKSVENLVNVDFEIEYSSTGVEGPSTEIVPKVAITEEIQENILLASSDEEKSNAENLVIADTCINLRDDSLSISETTVDGERVEEENFSNDVNTIRENNNAVVLIDDQLSRESIENDDNSGENTVLKSTKIEEATDSGSSRVIDLVDIGTTSDINSILEGEKVEEENLSNYVNTTQENDNAVVVIDDQLSQESVEDLDKNSENTVLECVRMETDTDGTSNSATDKVETGIISDINSIVDGESVEKQNLPININTNRENNTAVVVIDHQLSQKSVEENNDENTVLECVRMEMDTHGASNSAIDIVDTGIISDINSIVDGERVEEDNLSDNVNTTKENNNAVVVIDDQLSQKIFENDENNGENTFLECVGMETDTVGASNSAIGLVDSGIISDINLIESTDLQNDEKKDEIIRVDTESINKSNKISEHFEVDVTETSFENNKINITETICNNQSEVTEEVANSNTQNEVHTEDNEVSPNTKTNCEMSVEI